MRRDSGEKETQGDSLVTEIETIRRENEALYNTTLTLEKTVEKQSTQLDDKSAKISHLKGINGDCSSEIASLKLLVSQQSTEIEMYESQSAGQVVRQIHVLKKESERVEKEREVERGKWEGERKRLEQVVKEMTQKDDADVTRVVMEQASDFEATERVVVTPTPGNPPPQAMCATPSIPAPTTPLPPGVVLDRERVLTLESRVRELSGTVEVLTSALERERVVGKKERGRRVRAEGDVERVREKERVVVEVEAHKDIQQPVVPAACRPCSQKDVIVDSLRRAVAGLEVAVEVERGEKESLRESVGELQVRVVKEGGGQRERTVGKVRRSEWRLRDYEDEASEASC